MASDLTDEELARLLQAEFEEEERKHQEQIMADSRFAASVAKAHEISDSETDSDSTVEPPDLDETIEPPDYGAPLDGSQDLFDSGTDKPPSSKRIKQNSAHSSTKTTLGRKGDSKIHEISDSDDSDGEKDTGPVKERQNKNVKRPSFTSSFSGFDVSRPTVTPPRGPNSKFSQSSGTRLGDSKKGQSSSPHSSSKTALGRRFSKLHEMSDSDDEKDTGPVKQRQNKTVRDFSLSLSSGGSDVGRTTVTLSKGSNLKPSQSRAKRYGDSEKGQNSSPHSSAKTTLGKRVSKMHEMSDSDDSDHEKYTSSAKQRQLETVKDSSLSLPSHGSDTNGTIETLSKGSSSTFSQSSGTRRGGADSFDNEKAASKKPVCVYGDKCYRKNPSHVQEFSHEGASDDKSKRKAAPLESPDEVRRKMRKRDSGLAEEERPQKSRRKVGCDFDKTVADVFQEFQPLSLFLTKVRGIDEKFNNTGAVSLKDILSPLMGNIEASCQFNFMFDIPWVVKQYPIQFKDKPLLLVHGDQGRNEAEMKASAAQFPHISFCRAKLEMMYGTHHTKMMLLLYDCGMRVVIHTANLISNDWDQKTQGVWISPLFPKLTLEEMKTTSTSVIGDSPTKFKQDLLAYIQAYQAVPLAAWEHHIHQHNMASACVYIIGSVPGRHSGDKKTAWGHMKLKKVLHEAGPDHRVGSWPVIGQFSSIGSLGASMDQWLCDEWLGSLSQCQGNASTSLHHSKLQLVYPSKENVRLCLEGYGGGGCLPYSIKTARKQIYLNNFIRQWRAEGRGRTEAIPHIKTYTRVSPDWKCAAWFLVTSANLSKAAWGTLEKQKTQLMIRSYEIGVLFLPRHFGNLDSFPVGTTAEEVRDSDGIMLPVPYDLPPSQYQKGDRIWMWDVPCVDLPDRHGKKYCPPM